MDVFDGDDDAGTRNALWNHGHPDPCRYPIDVLSPGESLCLVIFRVQLNVYSQNLIIVIF